LYAVWVPMGLVASRMTMGVGVRQFIVKGYLLYAQLAQLITISTCKPHISRREDFVFGKAKVRTLPN